MRQENENPGIQGHRKAPNKGAFLLLLIIFNMRDILFHAMITETI
jgi:hypothetical protein